MAVLYGKEQTWTGRLGEWKDTACVVVFTLDWVGGGFPVISRVEGLPYDAMYLVVGAGGVAVVCANAVVHVDQGRLTVLPVNGWLPRVSDIPAGEATVSLQLEGSQAVWADEKTLLVVLRSGVVYPVEVVRDGKTVTRLVLGEAVAQTTVPSVAMLLGGGEEAGGGMYGAVREGEAGGHLFVGSVVGPSVVVKIDYLRVEEEGEAEVEAAMVVDEVRDVDMGYDDDDDDLYGDSKPILPSVPAIEAMDTDADDIYATTVKVKVEKEKAKKYKTVMHLGYRDAIPAWGPISSIAFSLAGDGVSPFFPFLSLGHFGRAFICIYALFIPFQQHEDGG